MVIDIGEGEYLIVQLINMHRYLELEKIGINIYCFIIIGLSSHKNNRNDVKELLSSLMIFIMKFDMSVSE